MTNDASDRTLHIGDAGLIDALRKEFDAAWAGGATPRLEDFLARLPASLRSPAFRELLRDEAAQRRRRNEAVAAEAYLARFPEYSDAIAEAIAQNGQTETIGHASPEHRSGLHVRCPHCHNPIELVPDAELESIECGTCGSQFSLTTDDDEKTRDARSVAQVGHFKLIERLGMGAFGAVWKALDTELDRTVAIKIPRSGQLDKQRQDFFFREARSAAQLRHPNIVPVYEVGREGDTLYIVSEFVRGVTLSDRLSAGALGSRETAELCASIADALHHAHEQGVIHRDLKPANVMIDAMGAPHLMDFGLARREAGEITMTLDGQVLGTPAYMSPEQAQGEAHVADRRSDIYSLGAMLFELLTGELPFRGNARMLIHQVIHDEPPTPRKLNAAVPKDLETITLKCLEKDPKRRFATAQDLGDELRRYLAGEPIHSRPITRAEQAWRWCLRKPLIAGLSAAVAGLVVFAAVASQIAAVKQAALRADAEDSADAAREMQEIAEAVSAKARAGEQRQKELAESEAKARKNAEQLIAANREQLVRMNVLQGDSLVERNDPARALPWYVEALRLDEGDAKREAPHRLRVAALWNNLPKFMHLWQHGTGISHLAMSRDEKLLAVATDDQTVRVWNMETGAPVTPPLKHDRFVVSCDFSADGSRLVTAGGAMAYNGEVRLWDVATGTQIGATRRNLTKSYFQAGFTDAGNIMTSDVGMTGSGQVSLLSADLKQVIATKSFEPFSPQEVTKAPPWHLPTGRYVEISGGTGRVIDLEGGGREICELPQGNQMLSARFSSDGSRVFTTEWRNLYVWNAETGEQLAHFEGTPSGWDEGYPPAISAKFSRDNQRVTIAGVNRQVMTFQPGAEAIWDLETLPDVRGMRPFVSDDGRFVAAATRDGAVRIWDVRNARLLVPPLRHPALVVAALFTRDDRTLVTACSDGSVRKWDLATAIGVRKRFYQPALGGVRISSDGKVLTTFGHSSVRQWNTETDAMAAEFADPIGAPRTTAASPEFQLYASADDKGTVRVWNYATGKPVSPELKHEQNAHQYLRISSDGQLLATINADAGDPREYSGVGNVWHVESGRRLLGPYGFGGIFSVVGCVEISPDGKLAAIGGANVTLAGIKAQLKLIDLATSKEVDQPFEHSPYCGVYGAAFDPLGRYLASITRNPIAAGHCELRLWDLHERREIGSPRAFPDDATSVQFDPQSRWVVVAVGDQVHLLSTATGKPHGPPLSHDERVSKVTFSPDGDMLATCSDDRMVRVWDAATGGRVGPPFAHRQVVYDVQLTESGTLLTACADDLVWVWPFAPTDRPYEDVARMARMLGADAASDSSELRSLGPESAQSDWEALRAKLGEFRGSYFQSWIWHDVQATDCWNRRDWLAAIPHFERMEELDNVNYVSFGTALCEAGQFDRGAEKFDASISQRPDEFWNYYTAAAARLRAGNLEGYEEACERILERFGKTDDPRWAANVAKICLLGPNDFEPGSLPFELSALALSRHEGHAMSRWIRLSGALAAYREGELARARSLAEELLGEPNEPERIECARFLLAMILWQQGDQDAARVSLRKGLDHRAKHPIGGAGSWLGRSFSELFQREAEKLLTDQPAGNGAEPAIAE